MARTLAPTQNAASQRIPTPARWDSVLALLSIVLGFVGLAIVNDPSVWNRIAGEDGTLEPVARLLDSRGGVRTRRAESPVWHDATGAEKDLAEGDAIFTAEDGQVTLQLKSGVRIDIGPQSLVVLKRERGGGSGWSWLQALRTPPREVVTLHRGAARAHLSKSSGALRVESAAGKARVVQATVEEIPVEIIAAPAAGLPVEIRTPEPSAIRTETLPETAVPKTQAPEIREPKRIEAPAPDAMREEVWKTAPVEAPKAEQRVVHVLPIKPVVSAKGLKTQKGAASTKMGETMNLDKLQVRLQWEPLDNTKSYTVNLYVPPSGKKIKTYETPKPTVDLELHSLKDRRYDYQVTAHLQDGATVTSGRVPVVIQIAPPAPTHPAEGTTVPAGKATFITWERTTLTRDYTIQVSRSPKFTSFVAQETLPSNVFVLNPSGPGIYYWRVKSHGESWQSDWSAVRRFVQK